MLAAGLAELEYALGAAALLLVVWLARELLVARRWRELIDALHRLADALDDLGVYLVDVVEGEPERETGPEP